MCVLDEAFLLGPPNWFNPDWVPPHDRESLKLFAKYRRTVPPGVIPNGPTVQGLYFMTAEGEYLGGDFANTFLTQAKQLMNQAMGRFKQVSPGAMMPVPLTRLDNTLGKAEEPGGLKLRTVTRDLPRGDNMKPGRNEMERCAHNISWLDLNSRQAAKFVTENTRKQPIESSFLMVFAKTMKDTVRGQMSDWKPANLQDGKLWTQCVGIEGEVLKLRITGHAKFREGGNSYTAQIHGQATFNKSQRRFDAFELVSSGQRTGAGGANGRQGDLGPAPMGVAYRLHRPTQ